MTFGSIGRDTPLSVRFGLVGLVDLKNRLYQGLSYLPIVALRGGQIADRDLMRLAGFHNLETLYLLETRVTDAGLKSLKGAANLKRVVIYPMPQQAGVSGGIEGTSSFMTQQGIVELQALLPNVQIVPTDKCPNVAMPDYSLVR